MTAFRFSFNLPVLCLLVASANAATPAAVDRGPLTALAAKTPISMTIALGLPRLSEAEALQQAIYTPSDPQFHRFLSAQEFVARFAPTDAEIAKAIAASPSTGSGPKKPPPPRFR